MTSTTHRREFVYRSSQCNPAVGHKVMVNGMAKSGTHLAKRVLALMGYAMNSFCLASEHASRASVLWTPDNEASLGEAVLLGAERPTPIHELLLRQVLRGISSNQVINGHNVWSDRLENVLKSEQVSVMCIVRDPRDIVISLANYLDRYKHPGFAGKTFDEKIMLAIEGVEPLRPPLAEPARVLTLNECIREVHRWSSRPHVLTLKFEDLVGPEGGGSRKRQLLALEKMMSFSGKSVDDLEVLRDRVFGRSRTFNVGKAGQWQTIFTRQHKDRFKALGGEGLIQLGYEWDSAW